MTDRHWFSRLLTTSDQETEWSILSTRVHKVPECWSSHRANECTLSLNIYRTAYTRILNAISHNNRKNDTCYDMYCVHSV